MLYPFLKLSAFGSETSSSWRNILSPQLLRRLCVHVDVLTMSRNRLRPGLTCAMIWIPSPFSCCRLANAIRGQPIRLVRHAYHQLAGPFRKCWYQIAFDEKPCSRASTFISYSLKHRMILTYTCNIRKAQSILHALLTNSAKHSQGSAKAWCACS
jgi:hypothetical protein